MTTSVHIRETNQNTQEIKNESFLMLMSRRQKQCANFRHAFPNLIFAREDAFQQRSSTKCLLSSRVFYICLSVCRFVKGNKCRKFANCFKKTEHNESGKWRPSERQEQLIKWITGDVFLISEWSGHFCSCVARNPTQRRLPAFKETNLKNTRR